MLTFAENDNDLTDFEKLRVTYGNWCAITHRQGTAYPLPNMPDWIIVITVPLDQTAVAVFRSDYFGKVGKLLWELE